MHISIYIGKDKLKTKQSTSMPKYARKAKLSYAHTLQNQKKSNFMSPIVHENVVHRQSPLDRIPKKQRKQRKYRRVYMYKDTSPPFLFVWFKKKKMNACT